MTFTPIMAHVEECPLEGCQAPIGALHVHVPDGLRSGGHGVMLDSPGPEYKTTFAVVARHHRGEVEK